MPLQNHQDLDLFERATSTIIFLAVLFWVFSKTFQPPVQYQGEFNALILAKYSGPKLQYITEGGVTTSEFLDSYLISIWDEDLSVESEMVIDDPTWFESHQVGDTIQVTRKIIRDDKETKYFYEIYSR